MPGVKLAEGVVEVTADAKGVPSAIANDIERGQVVTQEAGQKIGKQVFGGIITAWAAVGAAEKIGGFFTGSITGASDLNETMSKSSVLFGNSARSIELWGDTAAKRVGLSKEAAIGAAAGFGDMFMQLGFVQDQAAGMSTAVVQAAADLGSFSNLDTADVSERIAAAFRGEYDSLQAVIPNINAARVESEALAATGKTVASELTAQEKATAVLAIVQKDGARAMGDFERTSNGAANQTKIMTAQMEDQQAKLGGLLLPAWTGFLSFLNTSAIPAFGELIGWMGENGDTMLWLGGIVAGAATAYWAISSAMAIHKAFMIASTAATGGLTFAQWALNTALTANPIGLVITAIAALVAGIVWVATQTTFFQDAWSVMTDVIGTAWNWLWTNVLSPVFTAIGTAVGWLVTNVFEPVGSFISDVVTNIATVFTWLYQNVIYPIIVGIMLYIGLWAAVFTWLWESAISPVIGFIASGINWLLTNVFAPFGSFLNDTFTIIGLAFGIMYSTYIQPVANFIGTAIGVVGAAFAWFHQNAVRPAVEGVGNALNWVWTSIISPVFNAIAGAVSWVGNTVSGIFGGIAGFIGNAFTAALNAVRGPINGIIGLVNSAIRGLNTLKVTIPDWVPIVGGQTWGLSLPTIPMLARGSANAPDVFIAGENGPELIVGGAGSRVYPADQTRRMIGDGGGEKHYHLEQTIVSDDPELSARKAAREFARYLGV